MNYKFPDLPASIAERMKKDLPEVLRTSIDDQIEWCIEIEVSPITGVAEKVKDIINAAKEISKRNNWDYTISLTDLPLFSRKNVV